MEAQHIKDYLAFLRHEKQLAERTIEEYHRDLSQYVYWCAEACVLPLRATPNNTREYIRCLSQEGKAKTSLARKISALKSFYKWAMMDGHAESDAAYYLSAPKKSQKLPVYLNEFECSQLLSFCAEGDGINAIKRRAIIKILYYCGLRSRELTKMKLTQIECQGSGEPVRIRVLGKGNKERIVPIPEPMQKDLMRWMGHRMQLKDWNYSRKYSRTAEYIHSKYLFPSPAGKELSYESLSKIVKGACKGAEIEKNITPHALRHTCATNLLRRGVPITTIRDFLGHEDISTTQIYAHVEQKQMEIQVHGTHVKPEAR